MSDGYRKQRNIYGNMGGSLLVTPFIGQTTLAAPSGARTIPPTDSGYTLFLQRVHVHCSVGQAGTTWAIQDSGGNSYTGAIKLDPATTAVGDLQGIPTQDPIQAEFDFGPEGIGLPAGASLQFVPSATGAMGVITWDAYQRLSSVVGFGS